MLSATNANIQEEVSEGRLREDLLYRLNTVQIHLPPLRDRREDILPLAMHFLPNQADRYKKNVREFATDATKALMSHGWPGNVRELEHAVERAVLLARSEQIRAADLGLGAAPGGAMRLEDLTLDEAERVLIEKALERHSGNVSKAAEALGLSRSALYRRLPQVDSPDPK
jgi:DNA-binding NtrC family response regulator